MKINKNFQKSLVYSWEHSVFTAVSKKELTLEEVTELVTDVCKCYGLTVPNIVFMDGYQRNFAQYVPCGCKLEFPKWSRRRYIVLHEVSHYINHMKSSDSSGHGETFFGIYSYLLSEYNGYPLYEILHKASKVGIKYSKEFPKFTAGTPNPALIKPYS